MAGQFAYQDPEQANAYGPAVRSVGGSSATQRDLQADQDAYAIDVGRDRGSQGMLDEHLDKVMGSR